MVIIAKHMAAFGTPCAGSTSDVWSLRSCRDSFGCLRVSLVLDGDMLAGITGDDQYRGQLIDMSPIVGFERFAESHHTDPALVDLIRAICE